ncbi:response regulator transcription factor [Rhizobiales bacterium L72]|uniref:Response regulator transcription factor n=1 Tax=Propylenella binzhouense TaxID=2555902 RepID=A0A964T5F0_9HYPH|nr:response regulator transcription factor [Propylenella binzhouense]MYZ48848.1 response regulator transcription factor [Propylenella binzhouense]
MQERASGLPDDAAHLLVIDDDSRIRNLLTKFLGSNGFRVTAAGSAAEARRQLDHISFDLLVVDVMMPGESGLELTRSLRANSDVPVLMLTARGEARDRIEGLETGADDYLAKPFEPRELLLRINNILRRGTVPPSPAIDEVRFGPFVFHIQRGELKKGGEFVRITEREREMLRLLASRPGDTIRRYEFLGEGGNGGERTVDVQINRLRRKIEGDPSNPIHLHTVRGIGYRLLVD